MRCPRCLLGWWDWPAFEPSSFYDQGYFQGAGDQKGYDDYAALEAGLRRTARGRLQRISRYLQLSDSRNPHPNSPLKKGTGSAPYPRAGSANDVPRGACTLFQRTAKLLELGCGTGVFLHAARELGWDAHGVEVSAYASAQARSRGLDVATGAVESQELPTAAYDCIALWDVIEHLRDPAGVLRTAGRALRPGGILALSTGDISSLCARLTGSRWHLFNLPEHLFFFSPAALTRLFAAAGCRVAALHRSWYWLHAGYLCERLRKAHGVPQRLADSCGQVLRACGAHVFPASLFDVADVYALRATDE